MGIRQRWKWLCSNVIPAELAQSPDDRRRAELLVALALLLSGGLLIRGPSLLVGGLVRQGILSTGASVWIATSLVVLWKTRKLSWAGNWFVAGPFLVGASAAFHRGGVGAPVLVADAAAPLLALLLCGFRSGAVWFVAYLVELGMFAMIAGPLGIELVDQLPQRSRLAVESLGDALFAAVLFGIGMVYEWLKNIALASSAAAERERARAEEVVRMVRADRMASVGQLAAGVAHEINNPLSYIAGNLEFIERELTSGKAGATGSELREALSEARHGIERVGLIVRGLKTFARDDDEGTRPVNFCEAISSAVRIVENELRHRAQLEQRLPLEPLWVLATDASLVQVFLNLLLNAAQAIPPGRSEENTVRVVVELDDGGLAHATVEDTGAGMSDAVLAKATEPFFTTKPVGVGTGLGLSVCANVVRSIGGTLRIDSKEGQGTRVHVFIPVCEAPPTHVSEAPPSDDMPKAPRRLLLIDDDPLVARALVRLLRGHLVTTVTSGREALTLLEHGFSYDIILCDLMMPELTGADVYERIVAMERGIEQKIVFLTGGVFSDHLKAFLDSVPNPKYSKPINAAEVAEILARGPKPEAPDPPLEHGA